MRVSGVIIAVAGRAKGEGLTVPMHVGAGSAGRRELAFFGADGYFS